MPTVGEALVDLLSRYGIETVFGIPGVHTLELYRGLASNPRVRHVTPRHEQGAAFMADGYARAGGRPAACFLISGPGLANAATAIAQAYSDSVPMIVISSVVNRRELGRGGGYLHDMPSQRSFAQSITGASHTLLDPQNLPEVIAGAFASFLAGRPRPFHLEIPRDLLAEAVDTSAWREVAPPHPAAPSAEAVRRAAERLDAAGRVVMILGGGTKDAAREATTLAERLDAIVLLTMAAKGVVPSSHPLCVGAFLRRAPVQQALAEADVVLAVGTELAETDIWPPEPGLRLGRTLVRIDIEAAQLVRNYPADLAIVSDARAALERLSLEVRQGRRGAAEHAALLRAELDGPWREDAATFRPAVDALARATPADCVVAADSTQLVYTASQHFPRDTSRTWLSSCSGFGTLGYGLPAAIGAKLARPDRPVLCLIGGGGLLYTVGELAVAVEHRLPIPIVLWNNAAYGEIALYMDRAGIPRQGVALPGTDFGALARAFGCGAARPTSEDELARVVRQAFAADGPTLVELEAGAFGGAG